jgi:hypothetical protein
MLGGLAERLFCEPGLQERMMAAAALDVRLQATREPGKRACFACGREFRVGSPLGIVYDGDAEVGCLCYLCLFSDEEAIEESLQGRASELDEQAHGFRTIAARGIRLPPDEDLEDGCISFSMEIIPPVWGAGWTAGFLTAAALLGLMALMMAFGAPGWLTVILTVVCAIAIGWTTLNWLVRQRTVETGKEGKDRAGD